MTNRGFTPAEMQQHTIRANQAALQPADTCRHCGARTRWQNVGGTIYDLCTSPVCGKREVRLPGLQASIKRQIEQVAGTVR